MGQWEGTSSAATSKRIFQLSNLSLDQSKPTSSSPTPTSQTRLSFQAEMASSHRSVHAGPLSPTLLRPTPSSASGMDCMHLWVAHHHESAAGVEAPFYGIHPFFPVAYKLASQPRSSCFFSTSVVSPLLQLR